MLNNWESQWKEVSEKKKANLKKKSMSASLIIENLEALVNKSKATQYSNGTKIKYKEQQANDSRYDVHPWMWQWRYWGSG